MPARAKAPVNVPADPAAALIASADKEFGSGSLIQMGDTPRAPWPVVSTGSVGLDHALGIGGYPRGRVIEIYGPEGSGKTTLALHAIANVQKAGGLAVMIDAEHALDPEYAANLGVNMDTLLLAQPDTGEQGLQIADMCVRSRAVDIIVIDSVAALVPRAELEGEMGDSHVGLQARMMSQALRKLTGGLATTKTTCIFINQLREKIGIMFGSPETTTGGKALKFYASVRLDVRRIQTLGTGSDAYGQRAKIKVVKNKMAPPFKVYETDIVWGRGFVRGVELVELGVLYGVITKAGAFYSFDGQSLGQGKEKASAYLEANPETADRAEMQLRARMAGPAEISAPPAVSAASPAELLGTTAPLLPAPSLAAQARQEPPGGNDPDAQ